MSHHPVCARLSLALFFSTAVLLLVPLSLAAQEVQIPAAAQDRIAAGLPTEPIATPQQPRKVLIYSKTLGFRHDSIPVGAKALQMLGEKTGAYQAVCSEDPAMFDQDQLQAFDAVVLMNTTGDFLAPHKDKLTDDEQATLERRKQNLHRFVSEGKGLVGSHAATDGFYGWREFGDMIGGWFTGHPWTTEVPLKIDSPGHPLIAMFDPQTSFVIKDEIYQFGPRGADDQPYSRDKLHVLLSLDAAKFDVSKGGRADQDYAVSWIQPYGQGRVFYCSLGHFDFVYWQPTVLRHYLAGIQYALGDLPADATPSAGGTAGARTVAPFNGSNLDGWQLRHDQGSHWVIGQASLDANDPAQLAVAGAAGELINVQGGGVDVMTVDEFGDCTVELEMMVPQRSNSGIYLQGNYEIQVLDSYGKQQLGPGDIGGIYGASAPRVNAAKAPGEWQKFVIEFQAPRFQDGKKVANAVFKKITLNDQVIQENVEVKAPTGGNLGGGDVPQGPLMFQGDHGPVAFRNIKITLPAHP